MSELRKQLIRADDSPSIDAFSRWRVSNPTSVFSSKFVYNLSPLLYEQITSGTGTITHDAANSSADFATTGDGVGSSAMQSYRYIEYQPGKSQLIFTTFRFGIAAANVTRRIGLFDENDGFYLEQTGATTVNLVRLSSSSTGNQTVAQANWNLDKLDGTGTSRYTLDLSKCQILIIDAQWLGVGRVRIGFDIDGVIIYAHEFLHANNVTDVYCRTLSLPIRASLTTDASVISTMSFICASVQSEGGVSEEVGLDFSQNATVTAGNNTRTHLISFQPTLTFNSITNRTRLIMNYFDLVVTGNNPVYYEICLGQALTGTTTFNDVNTTYSAMSFNTAGTLSGNPLIVIDSGYCAASAQSKSSVGRNLDSYYPITLNAAGAVRELGRMTILVTGVGATSACSASFAWREIR